MLHQIRQWARVLALLALAAAGTVAAAHPMPESRILVDTRADGVTLTLQLPLNRLEFAYRQPLSDAPASVLPRHAEGLSAYLLQHVGARSRNIGWQALRPQLAISGSGAAAELEAVVELRAPTGADTRRFTLLYDAVTHEVRTHRGLVYLRNDWAAGRVAQPLRLIGEIDAQRNVVEVELDAPRAGAGFRSLFVHGAKHIAAGTDHLLFLLTLLLVAPLTIAGRHWGARRPAGQAVRRLVGVVTAFTAGHSITLTLGSTGLVTLPTTVVETVVAASILMAAVHALRPLLRHGELAMAGGFGLLHGLAFATSLSGAGLTTGQHALALLAFNLGIEAMQLLVVACVVPPLIVLAGQAPRAHAALRSVAASAAIAAAAALIAERLAFGPTGVGDWLEAAAVAGPPLAALLWLSAGVVWLRRPRPAAA
jgi:hypothetical protein